MLGDGGGFFCRYDAIASREDRGSGKGFDKAFGDGVTSSLRRRPNGEGHVQVVGGVAGFLLLKLYGTIEKELWTPLDQISLRYHQNLWLQHPLARTIYILCCFIKRVKNTIASIFSGEVEELHLSKSFSFVTENLRKAGLCVEQVSQRSCQNGNGTMLHAQRTQKSCSCRKVIYQSSCAKTM